MPQTAGASKTQPQAPPVIMPGMPLDKPVAAAPFSTADPKPPVEEPPDERFDSKPSDHWSWTAGHGGVLQFSARADEAAKDEQTFELLVVGPDGKPVPEASVEIRTSPLPTAEQIAEGKFVRKGPYGAFATTDDQGRLVVKLPRTPKNFDVNITTPGYGPYWAGWSSESHPQPVPARFTAELEAGWSVGGIIVDSEGKPVEGVKVHPSIEFKKRPGDVGQFGIGTTLKTDAAGKWRFDSVPASKREVSVEISHPSFKPHRPKLTRSEFGIERGKEPGARIELDRGLTVTGIVTDDEGKPIAGRWCALSSLTISARRRRATTASTCWVAASRGWQRSWSPPRGGPRI